MLLPVPRGSVHFFVEKLYAFALGVLDPQPVRFIRAKLDNVVVLY